MGKPPIMNLYPTIRLLQFHLKRFLLIHIPGGLGLPLGGIRVSHPHRHKGHPVGYARHTGQAILTAQSQQGAFGCFSTAVYILPPLILLCQD